jgi:hypothetical protein
MMPRPGDPVDLARFARIRWWAGTERHDLQVHDIQPDADGMLSPGSDPQTGEWQIGLEWAEPRDVRQVVVRFADAAVPADLRVQYWRKNWPTPAPERRPGARRGWIGRDDPWHGQWTTVRAAKVVDGASPVPLCQPVLPALDSRPGTGATGLAACPGGQARGHRTGPLTRTGRTFTFDPIDLPELGGRDAVDQLNEAEHYLARFRRTLKVRLVGALKGEDTPPRVAEIRAYSASTWREGRVDVRFNVGPTANVVWSGRAEAANGYILGVEPLDPEAGGRVEADGSWQSRAGLRLRILYTDSPANDGSAFAVDSGDCTVVTLRTDVHSFSFLLTDLARGPIHIPDYGAFITWADSPITFEAFQAQLAQSPRPIYDRVCSEPASPACPLCQPVLPGLLSRAGRTGWHREQSLSRALAEIPPLDVTKQEPFGRYLPLGVEAGRQEFALRFNGELFGDKRFLKLAGRDAARLIWPGHQLRFRFGTGDPPDFRERREGTAQSLLDGWLPVVVSRWLDREIEYEETAFAALLDGPLTGQDVRRGDENVVVMLRFRIALSGIFDRNVTHGRKRARLWIHIAPQEQIELRDGLVVAVGRVVPAEPVARQWRVAAYD